MHLKIIGASIKRYETVIFLFRDLLKFFPQDKAQASHAFKYGQQPLTNQTLSFHLLWQQGQNLT